MERVKGYRKKRADDSYAPLVPFGSDGILIDMLSGLHLEYELVIGGKRNSTITENSTNILVIGGKRNSTITENSTNIIFTNQYYNNSGAIQYTLTTTIPQTAITATSGTVNIIIDLFNGNSTAAANRLKRKTLTLNAATGAFTEALS